MLCALVYVDNGRIRSAESCSPGLGVSFATSPVLFPHFTQINASELSDLLLILLERLQVLNSAIYLCVGRSQVAEIRGCVQQADIIEAEIYLGRTVPDRSVHIFFFLAVIETEYSMNHDLVFIPGHKGAPNPDDHRIMHTIQSLVGLVSIT